MKGKRNIDFLKWNETIVILNTKPKFHFTASKVNYVTLTHKPQNGENIIISVSHFMFVVGAVVVVVVTVWIA